MPPAPADTPNLDDPAAQSDRTPPQRHWPALAALAVASAVWTASYLRHSFRHGRLGLPPLYDDVTYLLDGARRIAGLREDGLAGLVRSLSEYPPKSLIATIHATVAFLVFGVHDWAPYVFNLFVVFAILTTAEWAMRGPAGAEGRFRRPLPVWPRVGVCLLLLGCPMLSRAVNEFRPDFFGAFAIAAASFAMLDRPLTDSSRRRLFALGFLVGVSIAAKPTATPAALLIAGLALGTGLCIDLARVPPRERGARTARAAGWIAAGALVLPLIYAPFGAESTWNYVQTNLFGPSARLWTPDLTPQEGLLYYITGTGGQYMLGEWAIPLTGGAYVVSNALLLIALALFGLGYRAATGNAEERWRTTGLFVLLLVSWAIPTLTPIKHGLFGLQFEAVLIICAARGMRDALAMLMPIRAGFLAIPIALAAGGLAVGLVALKLRARPMNPRANHIQEVNALYPRLYEAIRARAGTEADDGGRCDVLLTFTGWINHSNLEYLAVIDGRPIHFQSRDGLDRPEKYEPHLAEAQFVLALSPGSGHEIGRFPSLKFLDEAIDLLDARPDFERVEVFPVRHTRPGADKPGRHPPAYILYVRTAPPPQPTPAPAEPPGAPPP